MEKIALDRYAIAGLVALKLGLHLGTMGLYGFHRDEIYLRACSRRLEWGSLDHAPLTPAISWLSALMFGDAPAGQRVLPAVSGAAVVWLTALAARRLGGMLGAQLLAGACALISPIFLYGSGVLGTNSFDQLFWSLGSYLLLGILTGDDKQPRRSLLPWMAVGLVFGAALLNKYTALIWGGAAALALATTPARSRVGRAGPAIALGVAFVLVLPNLFWQVAHGFPSIDFYRLHNQAVRRQISLWSLFAGQPRLVHPLSFVVALVGLVAAFRRSSPLSYRFFGVLFVAVLAVIVIGRGKPYYIASAYPMLIAMGSVRCEGILQKLRRGGRLALGAFVVGAGAVALAGTLPVLPDRISQRLALHRFNRELIQFADWKGVASQIAVAYRTAPAGTGVLTDSYGTAAALEMFGGPLGLPRPVSGANSYYAWSAGVDLDATLALGYAREILAVLYRDVTPIGWVRDRAGLDNRFDFPRVIYFCRGKRQSLATAWPSLKRFD